MRLTPLHLISLSLAATLIAGVAAPDLLAAPAAAQVVLTVGVSPPPLPLYAQPPIPGPGYLWLPGYWDYDADYAYFWVPGTWVQPPRVGLLWTPGYWAYEGEAYAWHGGYWGERVGFYGGVDYGFGYTGTGFYGSEWRGDRLFYNRSVTNVINVTTITNIYVLEVAANRTVNHVSFNGGPGGLQVRPTPQEIAFGSGPHVAPTAVQEAQVQMARQTASLRETQNHGRPFVAATQQPTEFKGTGVVGARTAGTRPAGQAVPQGHISADAQTSAPGQTGGAARGLVGAPGTPNGRDLPRAGQTDAPPAPGVGRTGAVRLGEPAPGQPMALTPNSPMKPSGSSPSEPRAGASPQHTAEPMQRSMPQPNQPQAPQAQMQHPQLRQQHPEGQGAPQHGPGGPRPF